MKIKMLLTLLATIFIITSILACQTTKYVTVPLSSPPDRFEIQEIRTQRELIKSYQISVIKIAEWQKWYNIQVGSNYFRYTNYN